MCIIIILIVFFPVRTNILTIWQTFVYRDVVNQNRFTLIINKNRQCIIPSNFLILIGNIGSVAKYCHISTQQLPLILFSIKVFIAT